MKKLILLSIILFIGCSMQSNRSGETNSVAISLPTMQCSMCVTNIENALNEVEGIVKVRVKLRKLNATVEYNGEIINTQEIEQIISKAGYQANDIKADLEAYQKLAMCCQVP